MSQENVETFKRGGSTRTTAGGTLDALMEAPHLDVERPPALASCCWAGIQTVFHGHQGSARVDPRGG